MFTAKVLLLCFVLRGTMCLPCLSNESKEDFDKARKSLSTLTDHLESTISKLESGFQKQQAIVKKLLTTVGSKVKKLDNDFQVLGKDFKKTKWHKYNGHCYYFSSEKVDWFRAERKCREIGGYIVKIDDEAENKRIFSNRPSNIYYWLGLTDLKEGVYRWSFDQSKASYTPWYLGYGSKGTSNNCALLHTGGTWLDYTCGSSINYICESSFCF